MATDIEKGPALNRAGAYVIHDMSTGKFAGKILVAYPKDGAGMLRAALWDFTPEHGRDVQNGHANGYGYDKLGAALDSMRFGTGNQLFVIDGDQGIESIREQFSKHGYILQWVL